jgi:putative phosphoesterase
MLLGIISDTHDKLARTGRAIELLQAAGAEALVHCGDYTTPDIIHVCGEIPGYFVLGNNDDDVPALRRAVNEVNGRFLEWGGVITLAGKKIGVTHGHSNSDAKRVLAAKPDYFFFGHSHVAEDRRIGGVRYINPGALHRADDYTVALLNLTTDELGFLPVE